MDSAMIGARSGAVRGRGSFARRSSVPIDAAIDLASEVRRLRKRVDGLLNANNAEVERRRAAERQRDELGETLLDALMAETDRAERAERVVQSILRADRANREPDCRNMFAMLAAEGVR